MRKKIDLLMLIQVVLGALIFAICVYSIVTEDFTLLPWSIISVGVNLVIISWREYKGTKKLVSTVLYFAVSIFSIFVGLQLLFLNWGL